ncbi:OmpA family protein [Parabacteroides sp.]
MKKILIIAIAMLIAAPAAQSQWLKKLGEKAVERAKDRSKQKVEDKVNEKVDKTVDKVFETGENIITGNDKEGENAEENAVEKKTTPAADPKAKTDEQPQVGKDAEMSWNKFDFVPGDEVIYEDNLTGEQLGEFPSQWDLIEGNAEIAKLNGETVIQLMEHSTIAPLMKEPKNYLGEIYTIEFDYWSQYHANSDDHYENYGWISLYIKESNYDETIFDLGFHTQVDESKPLNNFRYKWKPTSGDENRDGDGDAKLEARKWQHVSLSFNKRAMKVYINQTRVANIPNMLNTGSYMTIGSYFENEVFIKNVRIAKGAVPLYDRMMTDGKFITYGITFDVGKSTIKPESMGEINRIVKLMQDNPDLKFSVEGHTDSTGNEATNQTLSDARSKAVVDKLVEMGIAADRLTSSGKGQSNPIADNGTDEGRAKNRRVEFVKM